MKNNLKSFDIAILGNGIIGFLSAVIIKDKFPNKKVAIIGNDNFKYSASLAAGAMHNVYCEIENDFNNSLLEQSNFEMGIKSREEFKKIFKKFKFTDIITAKDTLFYIKNESSEFEKKNFFVACNIAKNDKVLIKPSKTEIKKYFNGNIHSSNFECFKIKNEFAFNPLKLLDKIVEIAKKNKISIFSKKIESIKLKNNLYIIDNEFKAKKIVIAAGYGSYNIGKQLFKPVPVLKGVGSAFLLKNDFFKNFNHVIRTSDRGGAQCGVHLVPYNKRRGEVYLGAGNYISNEEEPKARAETLRYLINTIENELVPKNVIYKSTCETFFGYRPRSLDKYPSIGPVNDNIFYISGTYRSGLTWAAFIANQVLKWLENNKVDDLLKIYKPDRELNTYGTLNKACNHYAKSIYQIS